MIELKADELLKILVGAERYLRTEMAKEPELKKSTEKIEKAVEKISEQLFQQKWQIDTELYIETTPF